MPKKRKPQQKLIISLLTLLAVILISFYAAYLTPKQQYLEVSFVNVGQGDCAYISTPLGKSVLLDGGETAGSSTGSQQKYIRPFLSQKGVTKLDSAIVSHYHDDHGKGVAEVMELMPVNQLYMPDVEYRPKLHDTLAEKANAKQTELVYISRGYDIAVDEDTKFITLFPDSEKYKPKNEDANNDSLVLKLIYGKTSFLFTGDIEKDAEKALLGDENLKSDVIKVAHHGSNTSSIQEFIGQVSPSYALICVGANNRYNHPHEEIINRLLAAVIRTYRTDENGTITFIVDKEGILTVKTAR